MIAAVIALAALCALLVAALLWQQREHQAERLVTAERHQAERERLADRIQRPDMLPLRERTGPNVVPADPRDAKEYARVGTVTNWLPEQNGGEG